MNCRGCGTELDPSQEHSAVDQILGTSLKEVAHWLCKTVLGLADADRVYCRLKSGGGGWTRTNEYS